MQLSHVKFLAPLCTVALITISSFCAPAVANSCVVEQNSEINFTVLLANGEKRGYVEQNQDGSWFMWVEGEGAQNYDASTFEEAVNRVCAGAG